MTDPLQREGIDRGLLLDFFDESSEGLDKVSGLLVELESHKEDLGLINSIFRPIHSMKGNSAFFGLVQIKKLSHEMETILDMLRKRQAQVSPKITSALLEGLDALKIIIGRVRDGKPEVEDQAAFLQLVEKIKGLAKATVTDTAEIWTRMVVNLDRIAVRLGKEDKHIVEELESIISAVKILAPAAVTERGSRAGSELDQLQSMLKTRFEKNLPENEALAVKGLIKALGDKATAPELKDICNEALRVCGLFMNSAIGFDDLCRESLLGLVNRLAEKWPMQVPVTVPVPADAAPAQAVVTAGDRKGSVQASDSRLESRKTMRVAEESIDKFLEYVGELLVVGDMFHHIELSMAGSAGNLQLRNRFRTVNETFTALSDNLRMSIMSIRMVSVKPLLQKAPRIVRDIATTSGKDIAVEISGDNIEIDKSLVDLLDAPLTHMIRNSADHGIESPEERKQAGKNPRGVIHLSVSEDDRFLEMSVSDDGRGLNYEALQKKAESIGLVEPGKILKEQDVINLLFAPGVSTARVVTDVSGRGVGMDVVKRAIEGAGGQISCSSRRGEGSTFSVKIPRTVATEIMQGFLVRDGDSVYVLPMENILETVSAESSDLKTVEERGLCILRQNRLYPVCKLGVMFEGLEASWDTRERYTLVMVSVAGNLHAMAVDEVVGIQQVVIRSIDAVIGKPDFVSGGAVMGDGNIAVVVDIAKLFGRS